MKLIFVIPHVGCRAPTARLSRTVINDSLDQRATKKLDGFPHHRVITVVHQLPADSQCTPTQTDYQDSRSLSTLWRSVMKASAGKTPLSQMNAPVVYSAIWSPIGWSSALELGVSCADKQAVWCIQLMAHCRQCRLINRYSSSDMQLNVISAVELVVSAWWLNTRQGMRTWYCLFSDPARPISEGAVPCPYCIASCPIYTAPCPN